MPEVISEIDLQPFCDCESSRYAIQKPRHIGGKACATNGRVLIRCDHAKAKHFDPEEGKFPRVDDVMLTIDQIDRWGKVYLEPCKACKNTGFVSLECDRCYGSGNHFCALCERDGECEACHGEGVRRKRCGCDGSHVIGEVVINSDLAFLIDSLPDVEWQLSKSQTLLYFRFAFGDGAVAHRHDEAAE